MIQYAKNSELWYKKIEFYGMFITFAEINSPDLFKSIINHFGPNRSFKNNLTQGRRVQKSESNAV